MQTYYLYLDPTKNVDWGYNLFLNKYDTFVGRKSFEMEMDFGALCCIHSFDSLLFQIIFVRSFNKENIRI